MSNTYADEMSKKIMKTSLKNLEEWENDFEMEIFDALTPQAQYKLLLSWGYKKNIKTNPRSRKILIDKKFIRKVKGGRDVEEVAKRLRALGHHVITNIHLPTLSTMEKWMDEGTALATDGCIVEPDGICPHGHESWLLVLGYI